MEKIIEKARSLRSIRDFFITNYAWVLIVLTPMVLFAPMLLSGKVLFWGTPLLQFVPWREYAFEVLKDGYLPLWNPYLGMGTPLVANYQSALFYPPNFILLITGPAWGHGLLVLLHVIWTGLGMMLLVKQLGLSRLSQAIAGLAFSLSGYAIARAGFLSINATVSWLPWIVLAAERLIIQLDSGVKIQKLIKPLFFLSFMMGMQWLAGHAQTSWYCLLLTFVWILWRSYTRGRFPLLYRVVIGLGISAVMAFLLSAIQLLPSGEYLLNSHRAAEVERELAMTYSFWPWRLIGLIMPNLFGNPATGDYWGYANFWEDAIYIGVLPFILAIFAIWRGIKERKYSSLIILQILLIAISLIFALGKNTPIFPYLFNNIPTFNLFQAPTRWSIILEFCLVILAAVGAEMWQEKEILRLFWVRLGTVGGAAMLAFALILGEVMRGIKASFIPAIAMAGISVMVTGLLAWRRRIQPGVIWPLLIASFVAIDLIWAGSGLNPSVPKTLYEGKSQLARLVTTDDRVYMSADIEEKVKFEWTHRFDTFTPDVEWDDVRDTGLPNTPLLDRIPSANNFDPILPDRYVTWMESIENLPDDQLDRILAMMGVGWKATFDPSEENRVHYTQILNPDRFTIVGKAMWAPNAAAALHMTLSEDFDHHAVVVLEGNPSIDETTNPVNSELKLLPHADPNRLQITIHTLDDCWLVISDISYPGWDATVDGEEVQIYHANYLFRALRVPAGEHDVDLRYRPTSFFLGSVISLISWVSIGVALWMLKKK